MAIDGEELIDLALRLELRGEGGCRDLLVLIANVDDLLGHVQRNKIKMLKERFNN